MCTCIAGQLLLWQMRNALRCWGFFRANCQRKFAPEFICTETYRRAYKSQRLQCSTNCDGTASECIYIRTFVLVLFYNTCLTFVLHLVLVFYTCYQHHYIYLPRFRFTNKRSMSAIWEGTAILRTYQTMTLYI